MKRIYSTLLSLVFLVTILSSCTIQKRVHQRGYHVAWNVFHLTQKQTHEITEKTRETEEKSDFIQAYPTDEINYSSSNTNELTLIEYGKPAVTNCKDTIVPSENSTHDEYFDKRITPTYSSQLEDLPGKKEANLALIFGILAITSPVWILLIALALAVSSQLILQTLALYFAIGILLMLLLIVTAFTLSIHFLNNHGKDPNYLKYNNRAKTGLILASIIPGIVLLSIILAIAMA